MTDYEQLSVQEVNRKGEYDGERYTAVVSRGPESGDTIGCILRDTETGEWVMATLGKDNIGYGVHKRFNEFQVQDIDGSDEVREWYENDYSEFEAHVKESIKSEDDGCRVTDVHNDRVDLHDKYHLGDYTIYL